jgi:hypothetical protein
MKKFSALSGEFLLLQQEKVELRRLQDLLYKRDKEDEQRF